MTRKKPARTLLSQTSIFSKKKVTSKLYPLGCGTSSAPPLAGKMKIQQAQTKAEMEAVRQLFREYEAFLDVDLCFQSFEEELAGLPGTYSPPGVSLLTAIQENRTVGCVALRRLDERVCEMKRLFVRPEARGTGLGRKLAQEIISIAQELGYSLLRLDKLTAALHLYQTLDFYRTAPYYENPLPGVVYWELELKKN